MSRLCRRPYPTQPYLTTIILILICYIIRCQPSSMLSRRGTLLIMTNHCHRHYRTGHCLQGITQRLHMNIRGLYALACAHRTSMDPACVYGSCVERPNHHQLYRPQITPSTPVYTIELLHHPPLAPRPSLPQEHDQPVLACDICPVTGLIASASLDCTLRLWDPVQLSQTKARVRVRIRARVRARVRVRVRLTVRCMGGGTYFHTYMHARQGCQTCGLIRVEGPVSRASEL